MRCLTIAFVLTLSACAATPTTKDSPPREAANSAFDQSPGDASSSIPAPYTPLELRGRDVYDREGCSTCHSPQAGQPSAPDLTRVGGVYPHVWHYHHLMRPDATSPGSIMPSFAFLADARIRADAHRDSEAQACAVADELREQGADLAWNSELVAIIAYLQRLGRDGE